jgi:hypothetical protein
MGTRLGPIQKLIIGYLEDNKGKAIIGIGIRRPKCFDSPAYYYSEEIQGAIDRLLDRGIIKKSGIYYEIVKQR